jgi:hypothetical protein
MVLFPYITTNLPPRYSRLKLESRNSNMSRCSKSCYRGSRSTSDRSINISMSTCTAVKGLMKTSHSCWNQTPHLCSSLPYNQLRLQGTKRNSLLVLHLLVWEFYSQTTSSIIFSKTLICVKKKDFIFLESFTLTSPFRVTL